MRGMIRAGDAAACAVAARIATGRLVELHLCAELLEGVRIAPSTLSLQPLPPASSEPLLQRQHCLSMHRCR